MSFALALKRCVVCMKELPGTREFFPPAGGKNQGLKKMCRPCYRQYNIKATQKYRASLADLMKKVESGDPAESGPPIQRVTKGNTTRVTFHTGWKPQGNVRKYAWDGFKSSLDR